MKKTISLNKKVIFLNGGTGSFGKKFIESFFNNFKPTKIIVFSRDELKQYELMKSFNPKDVSIEYFIGDIRKYSRLL